MSKRPGFAYDGSKIVIVPTEPFSGLPAKTLKLSVKSPPQPGPKVPKVPKVPIHITQRNAQSQKQVQRRPKVCVDIPPVIQENEASDVTSKVPSNVACAVNKSNYSKNDSSKADIKTQLSSSNYFSSIGHMYKKPIKLNLSTSKTQETKLVSPIPKVNSVRKEELINKNKDYSARQSAVCQANLKVLVDVEEAQKQATTAYTKPMKQSTHTLSNSDKIYIVKNSNINSHQHTNFVQNNIDTNTKKYSSSLKTTKPLPLAKSVSEKVAPSKKDLESTSTRSTHKSLSLRPSDKIKAFEFVVDKNKDIESTLTSTDIGNLCKNSETKPKTSSFNKCTSLFKKKHHTSEDKSENKSKTINFKAKNTPCKSRDIKDKLHNENRSKTSGKSRSESKSKDKTPSSKERICKAKVEHRSPSRDTKHSTSKNECTSLFKKKHHTSEDKSENKSKTINFKAINTPCKSRDIKDKLHNENRSKTSGKSRSESKSKDKTPSSKERICKAKVEHRSPSRDTKHSTSKCITRSSNDVKFEKYKSSSKSLLDCKKSDKDDLLKYKIKSKVVKQINPSPNNQFKKQGDKVVEVRQKLSHRSLSHETEADAEEELESSTIVKTSTPKSVEYKTIELVINVRYEQPTTSSEKSSDLSGNEVDEGNDLNNMDLSFLDDINIDEIVNSLKDCEINSDLSKSDVEIFVSSPDECGLDSTLSLQSRKCNNNNNITENILDNSNMSDQRLRSISEPRNVNRQNETLSLQLDGIKTEPIETEKQDGFRETVDSEIRNEKVDDNIDHNAEKSRTQQMHTDLPFEATTQDVNSVNSVVQKKIKTEPPEIEYGNMSQEAILDVNSIQEEVPDELHAMLTAITSQPVRGCSRKGSIHELIVKDKINNESNTLSMDSLFIIHTESDLNSTLDTEESSLTDKVNIKSKENNNSITMEQGLISNEARMKSLELDAGTNQVSSFNNSELETILQCDNNIQEKKQLETGYTPGTKPINIELVSVSDLTHNAIDFTNVDDIKPQTAVNAKEITEHSKLKTKIESDLSKPQNRCRRGDITTTVEPSKAEINEKNPKKSCVILQITSNSSTNTSSKLNARDPSFSRSHSPQNLQKITTDISSDQELNTDSAFIVVNEMSQKLLTTDEGSNKKHSDDTKSTGVKSEVSLKTCPVKQPQSATVNESESAAKEILNEILTKSIDPVKKDVEDKATNVMSQNEEPHNRNSGDASERCKQHVHSPIKSPKCDKSNTKEVTSPETNGILKGVDKVRGRKLEQRMLEYFREEYKVLSVINKGQYSIIYKCTDSLGRDYAAKVIKSQAKRYLFGIAKEKMLMQFQKDIPRLKLNFVYLVNGFTIQGRWCFLMEYYPKNLKQVLDENNMPFHIDKVQDLSQQLISAVTALRNNNIVHSDIKPTHIMMNSANNRLKLCGFDRAGPVHTKTFLPNIGTVNYRAPEIILGHSTGYSIDVWSTALVMYEMATNIILFPGLYNNDILFKHMCTLGNIPFDMINNSLFKDQYFLNGVRFIRLGENGECFQFKDHFYKSKRLEGTIHQAYHKYWSAARIDKKQEDFDKLNSFHKLLAKMLVLHPNYRIPIEFVLANPFIHDFPADVEE